MKKLDSQIREPVRSRLIMEFANKREELARQVPYGQAEEQDAKERIDEIDVLLENLAAQGR